MGRSRFLLRREACKPSSRALGSRFRAEVSSWKVLRSIGKATCCFWKSTAGLQYHSGEKIDCSSREEGSRVGRSRKFNDGRIFLACIGDLKAGSSPILPPDNRDQRNSLTINCNKVMTIQAQLPIVDSQASGRILRSKSLDDLKTRMAKMILIIPIVEIFKDALAIKAQPPVSNRKALK